MPLVIEFTGPYAAPKVVCDHCGTVIDTAQDGNYQWAEDGGADGQQAPMFFTHKACCEAFERTRGGAWGAIGLECLPFFLVQNLHSSWREAQASGRLMARE